MLKKIASMRFWKYIFAVMVPLCLVVLTMQQVDSDTWYVLAEGREIVENGLYYEDTLSMHEGLAVTVQNYGFAVVSWWIFSLFGMAGIYMLMIVFFLLILFLIFEICMLISDKNENLSLIIMMVTGCLMAMGFVVTREQMLGYVIMLLLIYVLELYIGTSKRKYLTWIPVLSLILINMRAATWLMIFLVMGVYLIDGIKKPKLHLQGYRCWPIMVAGIAALLVGFLNPYGMKMMTFIFRSYGDAGFMSLVDELQPFNPWLDTNPIFYAGIIGVITLYAFGNKKNVRVRYLLLLFGFLFLGLASVKGMGELTLVMFFPMALLYKDWKMPTLVNHAGANRMLVMWSGAIMVSVGFAGLIGTLVYMDDKPRSQLVQMVDMMDGEVGEGEKKKMKVYAGYNDGGYLEFRRYKPYLDPRGEVFLKKTNGKEDILQEWIDLKNGKKDIGEFIGKYDFDYMLMTEDDIMYDLKNDEYELIYDEGGDRLYKKVEL